MVERVKGYPENRLSARRAQGNARWVIGLAKSVRRAPIGY